MRNCHGGLSHPSRNPPTAPFARWTPWPIVHAPALASPPSVCVPGPVGARSGDIAPRRAVFPAVQHRKPRAHARGRKRHAFGNCASGSQRRRWIGSRQAARPQEQQYIAEPRIYCALSVLRDRVARAFGIRDVGLARIGHSRPGEVICKQPSGRLLRRGSRIASGTTTTPSHTPGPYWPLSPSSSHGSTASSQTATSAAPTTPSLSPPRPTPQPQPLIHPTCSCSLPLSLLPPALPPASAHNNQQQPTSASSFLSRVSPFLPDRERLTFGPPPATLVTLHLPPSALLLAMPTPLPH